MSKINKDNLRKTIFYLKKNGIKNTFYAMAERLQKNEADSYCYEEPADEALRLQRERRWKAPVTFSVLVPLYHTPEQYLNELLESVLAQTYPFYQLVLLDAGEREEYCNAARQMVERIADERIQYYRLSENKGIAQNTNVGLEYAVGDYIALLDHDDLLTKDALYEMANAVIQAREEGIELQMIYSDEDKCDGDAKSFFEPHCKKDFDMELLLTNNYICHFTALKAELFRELKLRGEYNGAQDFDLVLRVAQHLVNNREQICHIPKVLYHWRCHTSSTAANPESKTYAYEAGKKAVEDYIRNRGWNAKVEHLKHLGFYRVEYEQDIFVQKPEVGAVGGSLLDNRGRIAGGLMDNSGKVVYQGLRRGFSGYMNRAALMQEAALLDIRCMRMNPACEKLVEECLQQEDAVAYSKQVCETLKSAGYKLIWDPQWLEKL